MPSRTEATRAKAALCATGRLTLLRLFSTLPFLSPVWRTNGASLCKGLWLLKNPHF